MCCQNVVINRSDIGQISHWSARSMKQWDKRRLSMPVLFCWIPTLIARFMGPTWGPHGADRTQVGPILAPWTLLSGQSQRWSPVAIAVTSLERHGVSNHRHFHCLSNGLFTLTSMSSCTAQSSLTMVRIMTRPNINQCYRQHDNNNDDGRVKYPTLTAKSREVSKPRYLML